MKLFWSSTHTFADAFVNTLSAAFTILSHVITESSIKLAKYSPFS